MYNGCYIIRLYRLPRVLSRQSLCFALTALALHGFVILLKCCSMKKHILSFMLSVMFLTCSLMAPAQRLPESCRDSTPSLKECYSRYFALGACSYADGEEDARIKDKKKEDRKKEKAEKKKAKASKKSGKGTDPDDDDEYDSPEPEEKSDFFIRTVGKHFTELSSGTELLPARLLGKKPKKRVRFTASDGYSYDVPAKWNSKYLALFLDDALKAGVQVRFHLLLCPEMSPDWFFFHDYDTASSLASKSEMLARLEWYIREVTAFVLDWEYDNNHGKRLVSSYDVVSELFTDTGDLNRTPYNKLMRIFGDSSYAVRAFAFAADCVPSSVKLCYCDHSLFEREKAGRVKEFVSSVRSAEGKGRVDEIGVISHLAADWPERKSFFDACRNLSSWGLGVQIQQLDIAARKDDDGRNAYHDFMKACMENSDCIQGVSFRAVTASDNAEFTDYMRSPLFLSDYSCTANFAQLLAAAGVSSGSDSKGYFSRGASSSTHNLFDYVKEYGDLGFEEDGINELDGAIFSMLSYIHFEGTAAEGGRDGVSLRELSDRFFSAEFRYSIRNENWDIWQSCIRMLETASRYRRYEDIRVKGYVSVLDEKDPSQFSALVFTLSPSLHFVAFRGTDTSIAGWRDNFLMTCESQTTTQKLALDYMEEWAPRLPGRIHTGGHSKGANLAIYAAAQSGPEIQDRIEGLWNFEGPGFSRNPDMLERIKPINGRIRTYVPETSLVGVVMRNFDDYTVVESDNKLFLQHDIFSWHVDRKAFESVAETSRTSRMFDSTMNATIANLNDEQFRILINVLFDSMEDSGIHNVQDIGDNMGRFSASLTEACFLSGKKTRKTLMYVGKCLFKNFNTARKEEKKRK